MVAVLKSKVYELPPLEVKRVGLKFEKKNVEIHNEPPNRSHLVIRVEKSPCTIIFPINTFQDIFRYGIFVRYLRKFRVNVMMVCESKQNEICNIFEILFI